MEVMSWKSAWCSGRIAQYGVGHGGKHGVDHRADYGAHGEVSHGVAKQLTVASTLELELTRNQPWSQP